MKNKLFPKESQDETTFDIVVSDMETHFQVEAINIGRGCALQRDSDKLEYANKLANETVKRRTQQKKVDATKSDAKKASK